MRNSNSDRVLEPEEKVDGLSISIDQENGVVTLDWDEDSPYANLCAAIAEDNSLFFELLENYLGILESND